MTGNELARLTSLTGVLTSPCIYDSLTRPASSPHKYVAPSMEPPTCKWVRALLVRRRAAPRAQGPGTHGGTQGALRAPWWKGGASLNYSIYLKLYEPNNNRWFQKLSISNIFAESPDHRIKTFRKTHTYHQIPIYQHNST